VVVDQAQEGRGRRQARAAVHEADACADRRREGRRARPGREPRPPERDREGARRLDAKDNIERAIARGSGTGADAAAYEHISYEGYGPGGVAVYVDVLTDNRNRTAGEVRHVFARHDGNLAESGAVAWLFERKGVVLVDRDSTDEDELTLAAADAGAEDVGEEGSSFEVTCAPEDLHAVRGALEAAGIAVSDAEVTMLPKTTVEIEDEAVARKVLRLIDGLEENDDVQDVYANFDIPEHVLEAVAV
jgi:YebC/PmpR family DNA-binding regulatory protein